MALSGTIIFTNSNTGPSIVDGTMGPDEACLYNIKFVWTASQDVLNGTSTIQWSFKVGDAGGAASSSYAGAYIYGLQLTVNSAVVYYAEKYPFNNPAIPVGTTIASGSFTISHGTPASAKTFAVSCKASWFGNNVYWNTGIPTTNKYGSVSKPDGSSQVSATSGYVGEDITISISKYNTSFTNTLTYTFGSLSGTIATKTSDTKINWTLPSEFYNEMPNVSSKTGVITCEAYNGSTSMGTRTCNFTALVDKASNAPILTPTVVDIKPETLALTGDENTVIRYESMIEYAINATAVNGATIASQSVQCGTKKVTDLPQGVIDDVESGTFVFIATDSRSIVTEKTIEKNLISYVKPTCYQTLEAELAGETGAQITLTINGNYYHGSFGAVDNELKLEVRHTQNDGTMGDWVDLTDGLIPVFGENDTYKLEVTISGFSYSQAYTFQCRATDKLNYAESSQYTIKLLPVFDWSNDDFNFNVPVNMNGETVLRHNKDANNIVLSASGGHIYLRPGGTDDTTGETVIYPDGSVKFGGAISFGEGVPDYVIETGTEAMGTNGTWYWEKWASGKAICYGRRNFGRLAITTAITNIYRSAMLTQDFPTGLFIDVPEVINTSVSSASAYWGGWVLISNPTASSTGDFAVAHSNSLTLSASNVGFYVVGRWK